MCVCGVRVPNGVWSTGRHSIKNKHKAQDTPFPTYRFNMASVSLTGNAWNAYRVLDVDLNGPNSSCVGTASSTGRRCRWSFNSEQFSTRQIEAADNQLKSLSRMHPSDITRADLFALAENTLCRDFHQRQAGAVVSDWRARIEYYVSEHGEMLDVVTPLRQLQSAVREEREASRQEINETRRALDASQNCRSELTEQNKKLEGDQAASLRDLALLRRLLTELQTRAEARNEPNDKVERLEKQVEESQAKIEKNVAASSKEIKGLKESKARLDGMMTTSTLEIASLKAKIRDQDLALDERAKRSEEEAEDLRQQLAASGREIAILQEAKAKFEEKASLNEIEAESMRQGLEESKVRHEASEAKSSEDSKRLGEHIEALEQKYTGSKNENTAQISRLQEQDRKIDRLVKQVDVVQQELTKRDRHFEQLARHMDVMKQDSAERDRHVGQLVKQMEMATQDSVERGREVEQLMKQMKVLVLKQEQTEREVGGLATMKIGGNS